jgi:hypothetical protein
MPFTETPEGRTQYCTHTDDNSICSVCLGNNMNNNTEDWVERFPLNTMHGESLNQFVDFIRTLLQEQSNKIISRGQEDWGIAELVEQVTKYGYNDEYGYYNDWADGVRPILLGFIRTIAQQEYQRGREEAIQYLIGHAYKGRAIEEIMGLLDKQL